MYFPRANRRSGGPFPPLFAFILLAVCALLSILIRLLLV
jgi:hypothetical protein